MLHPYLLDLLVTAQLLQLAVSVALLLLHAQASELLYPVADFLLQPLQAERAQSILLLSPTLLLGLPMVHLPQLLALCMWSDPVSIHYAAADPIGGVSH